MPPQGWPNNAKKKLAFQTDSQKPARFLVLRFLQNSSFICSITSQKRPLDSGEGNPASEVMFDRTSAPGEGAVGKYSYLIRHSSFCHIPSTHPFHFIPPYSSLHFFSLTFHPTFPHCSSHFKLKTCEIGTNREIQAVDKSCSLSLAFSLSCSLPLLLSCSSALLLSPLFDSFL